MAQFDKFYTKSSIAKQCYNFLCEKIPSVKDGYFLEPSAGGGSFLEFLPRFDAFDIQPEGENIKQADFLSLSLEKNDYITIGNPPFGKRSKLAINFFNHAAKYSKIIAFIVPVSFMKWSVQKELSSDFHLLDYFYLQENSFTDEGKDFSIRCVFQIWTKEKIENDLRLKKAPPTKHKDFELWQYNATEEAKKYIDEDWLYAVYRQGYKDYNKLFTKADYDEVKKMMDGNIQFFFMKPLTESAKTFIEIADFYSLAERNTATPGFGKADFVSYYTEFKEKSH